MKLSVIFTLVVLLTTSCSMPISIDSFEKELRKNSSGSSTLKNSKWKKEVLYQGYKDKYHFFYIDPGLGFPKSVKVLRDELYITHQFPYTDDKTVWLPYSEVK